MWRGYGQVITRGGNGGVAIGFDSADLQTLCNTDQAISEQTPLNISLNTRAGFKGVQKIRYNASEFPQLSSALSEEGYSPDLHLRWTAKLADFIKHCKDGAFQEEQEWRVWGSGAFHRSDIAEKDYTIIGNRFRRRFHLSAHPDSIGNDLTHPLAIREIRTGPNTDHETIKRFCDTWFRVNGSYDGPLVTKSRIPFR
nr:DUF2971 domain-containing protein [Phaeobacter sp. HF9A]